MDSSHLGRAFISRIRAEAIQSTAVSHPYLQAFRSGDFPDYKLALQDFACQYGMYSARFSDYLAAVIGNLTDAGHREILESNLAEEQGHTHDHDLPANIAAIAQGHTHRHLFELFQQAVGASQGAALVAARRQPGDLWASQFLVLCERNQYVGVGAIGIGTELIVSSIYTQIIEGLRAHSGLALKERVFFELHSTCDDAHAAQLLQIAEELAVDDAAAEQIEYGVRMALSLRSVFWDHMLQRAQSFAAQSPARDRVAAIGYETNL